jgi:hypothetical protein
MLPGGRCTCNSPDPPALAGKVLQLNEPHLETEPWFVLTANAPLAMRPFGSVFDLISSFRRKRQTDAAGAGKWSRKNGSPSGGSGFPPRFQINKAGQHLATLESATICIKRAHCGRGPKAPSSEADPNLRIRLQAWRRQDLERAKARRPLLMNRLLVGTSRCAVPACSSGRTGVQSLEWKASHEPPRSHRHG